MTRPLPVVDPPADARADGTIGGVVLAAGGSTRFASGNKLLADVDGEPLVRRAVRTLLESTVDFLVVVIGFEAERVAEALAGVDVTLVENPDHARGQATSVAAGIEAVRDRGADAAVIALGDMPAVAPATVDALIDAYRAGRGVALAAACDGQRGNPVLFDARFFEALEAQEGDTGGRDLLFRTEDAALVETGDQGVLVDVDTGEDLDRLA